MYFWICTLPISFIILPYHLLCISNSNDNCLSSSLTMTKYIMIFLFYLYCICVGLKKGKDNLYLPFIELSKALSANIQLPILLTQEARTSDARTNDARTNEAITDEATLSPEPTTNIPKAVLNNKLIGAMNIIRNWLQANNHRGLSPTSDTDYSFQAAKKFLEELISENRRFRLRDMFNYMYNNVGENKELATALAVVIMWSFNIPDYVGQNAFSNFQQTEALLVEALCSCRDSFVFDFVLNSLNRHDLGEDTPSNSSNNKDRRVIFSSMPDRIYSFEIEEFKKSEFMSRIAPNNKISFVRKLKKMTCRIANFVIGANRDQIRTAEQQYEAWLMIKNLHNLHKTIRKFDTDSTKSCIGNPPHPGKPYTHYKTPTVVSDNPFFYKPGATFGKDIIHRRQNPKKVEEALARLSTKETAAMLDKMDENKELTNILNIYRASYRNLDGNIKLYEIYNIQYERTFIAGKLFEFCGFFQSRVEELLEYFDQNDHTEAELKILKAISKKATVFICSLRKTYDDFSNCEKLFTEKNEPLSKQLKTLENRIFEVYNVVKYL